MKITTTTALSVEITEVEGLDPIRVVTENYEPGKGRINISCGIKAWTSAWFGMGGYTVQQFFIHVSNDYLIGCFSPMMSSEVDADNEANLEFVKSEICKLRREGDIEKVEARDMWEAAEYSDDVKTECCSWVCGSILLELFGDSPYYANWPTVPNREYQYLEGILDAVREAFKEMESKRNS